MRFRVYEENVLKEKLSSNATVSGGKAAREQSDGTVLTYKVVLN